MNIFSASDIHGNHRFYERIPAAASALKADAVVLAGDLLGHPDGFPTIEDEQRADAEWIVDVLEKVDIPVGLVALFRDRRLYRGLPSLRFA